MLFTPHVLTGAAIGAVAAPLGLPAVFGIAVVSHLVLDQIPHTDTALLEDSSSENYTNSDMISVIIEVLVGIAIVGYFIHASLMPLTLAIGAFGGVAIDLIDNVPFWKKIRSLPLFNQLHQFHDFFDGSVDKKWKILGIMTQFVVIVVSVIVLMSNI